MKCAIFFWIFLFFLGPALSAQGKTETVAFKGGFRQFHSLFARSVSYKMEDHVLTSNYYFQIDVNKDSGIDSIYEITGKTDIRAGMLIDAIKKASSVILNKTVKEQYLILPVFLVQADGEDKTIDNPFIIKETDFKNRWPIRDKIYLDPLVITYYEPIRCSMTGASYYEL